MQHSLGVVQLRWAGAGRRRSVHVQAASHKQRQAPCIQKAPSLFLHLSLVSDTCPVVAAQNLGERRPPRDGDAPSGCPSAERQWLHGSRRLPALNPDEPSTGDEVASAMLTCTSLGRSLLPSAATPCARCVCSNVLLCLCSQQVLGLGHTKRDLRHQASR